MPEESHESRLFLSRSHAVDLVVSRRAKGVEHTRGLLGEEAFVGIRREQRVTGADVTAPARYRRARPDGAQVDLLEQRTRGGVEGDQLAAGDGREIDDAV